MWSKKGVIDKQARFQVLMVHGSTLQAACGEGQTGWRAAFIRDYWRRSRSAGRQPTSS